MRYINRDGLTLPPGWEERAKRAYDEIKSLPPAERKDVLKKSRASAIWKALKEELHKCSDGKCWYCESPVTETAPGDVDHHRPKNEVAECSAHDGYWWLAFAWENYRYSCELCNRQNTDPETGVTGGKESHFPLWDETKRCLYETTPGGILCEESMLLDPVIAADPLLLTFDANGVARPARNKERFPKAYQRADISIKLYHLNRSKLKNTRQFSVCNKIQQLVARGDECLLLEAIEDSISARKRYNDVVEELSKMINGKANYSAAARAVLKLYRDPDHEWVQDILAAS